jgi:C4-dicarboxylate transporter, DctM subunit
MIPGVLVGVSLIILGFILAKKRKRKKSDYQLTKKDAWDSFKGCWPTLLAPFIIIYGITGGIFTPTEAGVISALYALSLGLYYRELDRSKIMDALWVSAKTTVAILFIIGCSAPFGWVIAHENVGVFIINFLTSFSDQPGLLMLFTIIIFLITGLFIDGLAAMLIFVPILFPVANQLGINPYHFAVVIVIAIEIGGVTPPVGVLTYIACAVANVPISRTQPLIWVFAAVLVMILFLVGYIPFLSTFVPDLLMP